MALDCHTLQKQNTHIPIKITLLSSSHLKKHIYQMLIELIQHHLLENTKSITSTQLTLLNLHDYDTNSG